MPDALIAAAVPAHPPPPTPAPIAPPALLQLQVQESEAEEGADNVIEHLSRNPKLARIVFAIGQATFLSLYYLDSSIAALSSWAALGAIVAASVASMVSPRSREPVQLSEFDLAPYMSQLVEFVNNAISLLHRIRSGDSRLGLKAGLLLRAAAMVFRPFSMFTIMWLSFSVMAGLPLIPQREAFVEEGRLKIHALLQQLKKMAMMRMKTMATDMPNAKYVLGLAAFAIWYRLSWTDMGLAIVFGALAAKSRYFGGDSVEFNKTIESAVAGAQKKARRLTISARSMFSPRKADEKVD